MVEIVLIEALGSVLVRMDLLVLHVKNVPMDISTMLLIIMCIAKVYQIILISKNVSLILN